MDRLLRVALLAIALVLGAGLATGEDVVRVDRSAQAVISAPHAKAAAGQAGSVTAAVLGTVVVGAVLLLAGLVPLRARRPGASRRTASPAPRGPPASSF